MAGGAGLLGIVPALGGGSGFSCANGFMGAGAVPLNSVGVTAVLWWYSRVIVSPSEVMKAAANSAIHGISRRARRGCAWSR